MLRELETSIRTGLTKTVSHLSRDRDLDPRVVGSWATLTETQYRVITGKEEKENYSGTCWI